MSDYSILTRLIKTAATEAVETAKPVAVLFGTVQSVSPLSIFVDQKTILEAHEIILSERVTDYQTKLSFDNPEIKQVYTVWDMEEKEESSKQKIAFKKKQQHDITLYQALKANDKVILLRVQGGQKFIVIDRIGGQEA